MLEINQQEDEDAYRTTSQDADSNQLDPAPEEINLQSGKCLWTLKGYRIWARNYKEAQLLLPLIESF